MNQQVQKYAKRKRIDGVVWVGVACNLYTLETAPSLKSDEKSRSSLCLTPVH
jgi:hypothetical protein